jgi:DnaK suppressor protein
MPITDAEVKEMRQSLLEERERILQMTKDSLSESLNRPQEGIPDALDESSDARLHAMSTRLAERDERLLKKIDKVLELMNNGEYGLCEECGEEIGVPRLRARPVTTLCIACKEAQEKDERQKAKSRSKSDRIPGAPNDGGPWSGF